MTDDPQPTVEERVARHLASKDWGDGGVPWARDLNGVFCSHYLAAAREVIALVQAAPATSPPAPADRAAILRELADGAEECGGYITMQELRRMARKAEATGGPSRVAGEAPQPETQAFVCKCPAELCHCGHHAVVSQPGKEPTS
jgi:hypothetical protein